MTFLNPLPGEGNGHLLLNKFFFFFFLICYLGIRNRAFTGIRSFHKPAIHRKYILSLSKVSGIMEASQEVVRTCPAGRGPQGADGPFCGFRAAFLASLLAPLSSPLLPTPVGKKPEAVLAFPPQTAAASSPELPVWRLG